MWSRGVKKCGQIPQKEGPSADLCDGPRKASEFHVGPGKVRALPDPLCKHDVSRLLWFEIESKVFYYGISLHKGCWIGSMVDMYIITVEGHSWSLMRICHYN